MKMIEKLLKIFWPFWNQWLKYRKGDPVMSFAKGLILIGVSIMTPGTLWWMAVALNIKPENFPVGFNVQFGPDTITYTGLTFSIIGIGIGICHSYRIQRKRISCLIYLRGLPGMSGQVPVEDLLPKFKYGNVSEFKIDIHDVSIEKALKNIETSCQMFDENILSMNIKAPYTIFAGFAPVPILYSIGVRLSTRKNLYVMDYNRFKQKWHFLDDLDDGGRLTIRYPKYQLNEDVGIVMPFSIAISESQIPTPLKNKIIWIQLDNQSPKTDSLSSEDKLLNVLKQIHDVIRNIRSRKGYKKIKRIHLFIAAQSSTIFRLGALYQENAYPEIRVYHFQEGRYTWGISIKKGKFNLLEQPFIKKQLIFDQ